MVVSSGVASDSRLKEMTLNRILLLSAVDTRTCLCSNPVSHDRGMSRFTPVRLTEKAEYPQIGWTFRTGSGP